MEREPSEVLAIQAQETHVKQPEAIARMCNPGPGEVETVDSWSSLISNPVFFSKIQVGERHCLKKVW